MSSGAAPYGDPETRRRILDAAVELSIELGPGMRLVDIARRAGVSHQAIYLHFGGRDGLLLALLPHMVEAFGLEQAYGRVIESATGVEALSRLVEWLSALNRRLDEVGWVLEDAQHLDEAFGEDWRGRSQALRAVRRQVVERVAGEGSLRPSWSVDDATDLFVALTTLGTWRELVRDLSWTEFAYTERVEGWLRRILVD